MGGVKNALLDSNLSEVVFCFFWGGKYNGFIISSTWGPSDFLFFCGNAMVLLIVWS